MYYALIPDLNTYLDCLRSHSVCSFLGKSCFLAFVLPVVLAYCPSCGLGLLSFLWSWPIVLPVVLAYYPSCGLWPIILPVVLAYYPSCGLGLLSFLWSMAYYSFWHIWPTVEACYSEHSYSEFLHSIVNKCRGPSKFNWT